MCQALAHSDDIVLGTNSCPFNTYCLLGDKRKHVSMQFIKSKCQSNLVNNRIAITYSVHYIPRHYF